MIPHMKVEPRDVTALGYLLSATIAAEDVPKQQHGWGHPVR